MGLGLQRRTVRLHCDSGTNGEYVDRLLEDDLARERSDHCDDHKASGTELGQ